MTDATSVAPVAPPAGVTPAAGAGVAPPVVATPPADEAKGVAVTQKEATTTKEGAEGKPEDSAPADVEVKLPEGVQADKALLDEFQATAKGLGLKSEGAQKIADVYVKAQAAQAKAQGEAHAAQVKEWAEAIKADPDFGGAKLEASKALVAKTVGKFGSPELVEFLDKTTGLANHPLFFRFFAAVGKAVGEDSIGGTTGGAPAKSPAQTEESIQQLWYPNSFKPKAGE